MKYTGRCQNKASTPGASAGPGAGQLGKNVSRAVSRPAGIAAAEPPEGTCVSGGASLPF
jgi:hypothetical protein